MSYWLVCDAKDEHGDCILMTAVADPDPGWKTLRSPGRNPRHFCPEHGERS